MDLLLILADYYIVSNNVWVSKLFKHLVDATNVISQISDLILKRQHVSCTQKYVFHINSVPLLLFMLNSGYTLKMTFQVFNCIIPDSLLNTMSRNPSFTHTVWAQFCSHYLLFKSMLWLSSSLWAFHPNVWRRSCPFSPLWAEGKYPQAALLLHWEYWKKWCRHFSDDATR